MSDFRRILYLDSFNGASGDMLLGALLEIGLDKEALAEKINSLRLPIKKIHVSHETRNSISGTLVCVEIGKKQGGRYRDIVSVIEKSTFSDFVKNRSKEIFEKILKVEAKIHNENWEEIHIHEMGSADAIVDILGVVYGFEQLKIGDYYCSVLPLGTGEIQCRHGIIPLPAPATVELLKGFEVRLTTEQDEKVTPTGAALIGAFFTTKKTIPDMTILQTGYGLGSRKDTPRPNYLRLILGESTVKTGIFEGEVVQIETNIDNMSAEVLGFVAERLLGEKALDVSIVPIIMKKGRPAHELCAIVKKEDVERITRVIFEETTTLGIRVQPVDRVILERREEKIRTKYGNISIKTGILNGRVVSISPEFEECKRIALEKNIPLKTVITDVFVAADLLREPR